MRSKESLTIRFLSIIGIFLLYYLVPEIQSFCKNILEILRSANIEEMKNFLISYGIWMPIMSILIMIFQSLFPFIPGMVITLANSWLFGWQLGALYSWIGALLGAIIDFLLSRFYGKFILEKLVSERCLTMFNDYIRENGLFGVLAARIIPIVPFKIVSYSCGLSKMQIFHFIIVTGIGQIPGILIYSIIGENVFYSPKFSIFVTLILIVCGLILYFQRKRIIEFSFCKWLKSFSTIK